MESGEQSTMVMGEGKSPKTEHLIKLGIEAKIDKARIHEIVEQTRTSLAKWPELAKHHGVSDVNIRLIGDRIS